MCARESERNEVGNFLDTCLGVRAVPATAVTTPAGGSPRSRATIAVNH